MVVTKQPMTSIWHRHLGHMSWNGLEILSCYDYLFKLKISNFALCEPCQHGKQIRNAHKIHYTIGPMPARSLGVALYFITFIDDATRKVWVYLTKGKDVVYPIFIKWITSVQLEKGHKSLKFYVWTMEVSIPLMNVVFFVRLEAFKESLRLLTPVSTMVWLTGWIEPSRIELLLC